MSINLDPETVGVVARKEATREIRIVTDVADPVFHIYRQVTRQRADGSFETADNNVPTVTRTLSQVAAQKFTLGDVTVTGLQLAGLIKSAADTLRQEDIAAAKAAAAEVEPGLVPAIEVAAGPVATATPL